MFDDTRRAREVHKEKERRRKNESEGCDKWVRRSWSIGRVLFEVLLSYEEEGRKRKYDEKNTTLSFSFFFFFNSILLLKFYLGDTHLSRYSHTRKGIKSNDTHDLAA